MSEKTAVRLSVTYSERSSNTEELDFKLSPQVLEDALGGYYAELEEALIKKIGASEDAEIEIVNVELVEDGDEQ